MRWLTAACFALLLFPAAIAEAKPRTALVRIDTDLGVITVEVDVARAPVTAGNFLAYVDQKRFDRTRFYRAARRAGSPQLGLIQGGIDNDLTRSLPPIRHEPTSETGLRHIDGTLSMARNAPGTAMGNFFITIGVSPALDARPGAPGYAAFGRVVSGMDVVRRILALPTWPGGFSEATKGQMIRKPVIIRTARRID